MTFQNGTLATSVLGKPLVLEPPLYFYRRDQHYPHVTTAKKHRPTQAGPQTDFKRSYYDRIQSFSHLFKTDTKLATVPSVTYRAENWANEVCVCSSWLLFGVKLKKRWGWGVGGCCV